MNAPIGIKSLFQAAQSSDAHTTASKRYSNREQLSSRTRLTS